MCTPCTYCTGTCRIFSLRKPGRQSNRRSYAVPSLFVTRCDIAWAEAKPSIFFDWSDREGLVTSPCKATLLVRHGADNLNADKYLMYVYLYERFEQSFSFCCIYLRGRAKRDGRQGGGQGGWRESEWIDYHYFSLEAKKSDSDWTPQSNLSELERMKQMEYCS